jgi:hypothetical protein
MVGEIMRRGEREGRRKVLQLLWGRWVGDDVERGWKRCRCIIDLLPKCRTLISLIYGRARRTTLGHRERRLHNFREVRLGALQGKLN